MAPRQRLPELQLLEAAAVAAAADWLHQLREQADRAAALAVVAVTLVHQIPAAAAVEIQRSMRLVAAQAAPALS
jgi:hypothetical protein